MIPEKISNKLRTFATMSAGWNFGEGEPFDPHVIATAKRLLVAGYAYSSNIDSDIFPGISGEIRVTFYKGNDTHAFTVESDLKITYLSELGDIEMVEHLNLRRALEKIAVVIPEPCPSPDSSLFNFITNPVRPESIVWHFVLTRNTEQFPLSTKPALPIDRQQRVNTSTNVILTKETFSFDSSRPSYQKVMR